MIEQPIKHIKVAQIPLEASGSGLICSQSSRNATKLELEYGLCGLSEVNHPPGEPLVCNISQTTSTIVTGMSWLENTVMKLETLTIAHKKLARNILN